MADQKSQKPSHSWHIHRRNRIYERESVWGKVTKEGGGGGHRWTAVSVTVGATAGQLGELRATTYATWITNDVIKCQIQALDVGRRGQQVVDDSALWWPANVWNVSCAFLRFFIFSIFKCRMKPLSGCGRPVNVCWFDHFRGSGDCTKHYLIVTFE